MEGNRGPGLYSRKYGFTPKNNRYRGNVFETLHVKQGWTQKNRNGSEKKHARKLPFINCTCMCSRRRIVFLSFVSAIFTYQIVFLHVFIFASFLYFLQVYPYQKRSFAEAFPTSFCCFLREGIETNFQTKLVHRYILCSNTLSVDMRKINTSGFHTERGGGPRDLPPPRILKVVTV